MAMKRKISEDGVISKSRDVRKKAGFVRILQFIRFIVC